MSSQYGREGGGGAVQRNAHRPCARARIWCSGRLLTSLLLASTKLSALMNRQGLGRERALAPAHVPQVTYEVRDAACPISTG